MLVRGVDVVRDAWSRHVAVAAFTTYSLESTRGICDAGVERGLPVILQAGSSSFGAVGRTMLGAAALAIAAESPEPVGVHLDHSTDVVEIRACIALGYSSVMVDGSHLSFEENIELTRAVVADGHRAGIFVEGELGAISGDENRSHTVVAGSLTTPGRAEEFAGRTGVDALAVAIGSVHGMSEIPVHLDLELLEEIAGVVPVPLVLHGASGLDDGEVWHAVQKGMAKVNFNAELRRSYLSALRAELDAGGDDVVRLQRRAIDAVAAVAREKLALVNGGNVEGEPSDAGSRR